MTGESEPPLERSPGKFANGLEEVLYDMGLEGWFIATSGDVQSPQGWFGFVSNEPDEVAEVAEAFAETMTRTGTTPAQLIGHFLLREDERGFVGVEEFDSYGEAKGAYDDLEREYDAWDSQDEEPYIDTDRRTLLKKLADGLAGLLRGVR